MNPMPLIWEFPDHYVSLEIARQIVKAGIIVPSKYGWAYRYGEANATRDWETVKISDWPDAGFDEYYFPRPSLSEILDQLPNGTYRFTKCADGVRFFSKSGCLNTETAAAAKMLLKIEEE